MIVAAADACVVQEHQTGEKASRELPTELQVINIHKQPAQQQLSHICQLLHNSDSSLLTSMYPAIPL